MTTYTHTVHTSGACALRTCGRKHHARTTNQCVAQIDQTIDRLSIIYIHPRTTGHCQEPISPCSTILWATCTQPADEPLSRNFQEMIDVQQQLVRARKIRDIAHHCAASTSHIYLQTTLNKARQDNSIDRSTTHAYVYTYVSPSEMKSCIVAE